jgi:cell division protein FtsB
MAQNRKYQAASVRFGPALKAVLLCLLIGGSGVGYVWQKSLIEELGRDRAKLEKRLNEQKLNNEKLRRHLAELRSPRFLDKRARDLGLVPAQPGQVLSLPEPVPWQSPQTPPAPAQFAARPLKAG